MKKQNIYSCITAVVSIIILLILNTVITGNNGVFKGQSEGETIKAVVLSVTDVSSIKSEDNTEFVTVNFKAKLLNSELKGKTVSCIQEIDKSYAFAPDEVKENDKVLVEKFNEGTETNYYFGDYIRISPLIWLGIIFCILVIVFSGTKGIKTLVSLGITCISAFCVLIPAILNGKNIYFWTIVVCLIMTASTLLTVSGYNKKSLCSIIGCLSGVAVAGIIMPVMDVFLNLTGLLEEESIYLVQLYPDNPINLKAIIFSMITIGALGAVMDVAMSISSSLFELKEKNPSISQSSLMKSGFNIGRDMMGTMANTLVLAYIGSNLTCVLLLVAYNTSLSQVINKEIIIAEILQALAGSLGMLMTLPLTSIICSLLYTNKPNKNKEDID